MPQILSMEGKGNERAGRQSIFSSFGDWFSSLHKFDKFFIIAALLIVVATPFIVSNNQNFNPEAARGGNGGGKHGGGTTMSCPLTASPNPVPVGSYETISGTGFIPNATINWNEGGVSVGGLTDANGMASTSFMTYSPGTGTIYASEFNGSSFVQCGSVIVNVVAPSPIPTP